MFYICICKVETVTALSVTVNYLQDLTNIDNIYNYVSI